MSWGAPQQNQQPGYNPNFAAGAAPQGYGYRPAAPPPGQYGQPPPSGPPQYGQPPPSGAPQYGQPPPSGPPQYGQPPAGQYGPPGQQPGGYGAAPSAPPPVNPSYGGAYGQPHPSAPPGGYGQPPPPAGYGGFGAAPPPPGINPELWTWFQSVDADKSGQITAEELRRALMNGNWTPFNAETCRLMIGMFDKDKSGTIDVQEFAALWKYIQEWKQCFDRFDTDRSGNINASELGSAFSSFGYRLSPQFASLCVRVFDRQSANSVKFDDFIQCCVMLKSLTDQFRAKDTQQCGTVRIHYEEFLRMVLDNGMV